MGREQSVKPAQGVGYPMIEPHVDMEVSNCSFVTTRRGPEKWFRTEAREFRVHGTVQTLG